MTELIKMIFFPDRVGNALHGFAFCMGWILVGMSAVLGVVRVVIWCLGA